MSVPELHLRSLPALARAGVSCVVLVLLLGFWASLEHLRTHHAGRDSQPAMTMDDLVGWYHGLRTTAPMLAALESGHPEGLADAERDKLLAWVRSDAIGETYDDLDLGADAPAEILARACLDCHARGADDAAAAALPLEYWDDVERQVASTDVPPASADVLVASTHTHALSLGVVTLLVTLLLFATRWPRGLSGLMTFAAGFALLADLGGWWLARGTAAFVPVIAVSGAVYVAAMVAASLAILADMWLPRRGRRAA